MRILLSLIIPTLLLFMPSIFQIAYTVMRLKNKTRISLFAIFLLTLVLGFILSIAATYISSYGISYGIDPNELYCVNGVQIFLFLGIGIAVFVTPLIGLTGALIQYLKSKSRNTSPLI